MIFSYSRWWYTYVSYRRSYRRRFIDPRCRTESARGPSPVVSPPVLTNLGSGILFRVSAMSRSASFASSSSSSSSSAAMCWKIGSRRGVSSADVPSTRPAPATGSGSGLSLGPPVAGNHDVSGGDECPQHALRGCPLVDEPAPRAVRARAVLRERPAHLGLVLWMPQHGPKFIAAVRKLWGGRKKHNVISLITHTESKINVPGTWRRTDTSLSPHTTCTAPSCTASVAASAAAAAAVVVAVVVEVGDGRAGPRASPRELAAVNLMNRSEGFLRTSATLAAMARGSFPRSG